MERQPFPRPGEALVDRRVERPRPKPPDDSGLPRGFGPDIGPRTAFRIGWAVCVLTCCAFLVAATIVILDLVRTRPLHGVIWLLAPAIPVAVTGVLWMISIVLPIGRRQPAATRSPRTAFRLMFGDLPRTGRVALAAIVISLLVSNVTAFPPVTGLGHPLPPTRQCEYRVNEQGGVTCTTEATYYRAGRDDQRYVASWFGLLFVTSLGVAAGALIRRRREG